MLHAIKQAIKSYLTQTTDPREMDAMSMTLHDCIRLVYPHQQNDLIPSAKQAEPSPLKIKWNLASPQSRFIESA
ncbi:MAG: hypothetical protein ABI614_08670 [Planctomycetota bacterium]